MLSSSHVRRKRHKLAFLKKHANFAETAFRDAVRLRENKESLKSSEPIRQLVLMARRELQYSSKTISDDIFWGLFKVHHDTMEEK